MNILVGLNYQRLDATWILPWILGFSPTTSLQDEDMIVVQGPQREENIAQQDCKPVQRRRHVRDIRVLPVI